MRKIEGNIVHERWFIVTTNYGKRLPQFLMWLFFLDPSICSQRAVCACSLIFFLTISSSPGTWTCGHGARNDENCDDESSAIWLVTRWTYFRHIFPLTLPRLYGDETRRLFIDRFHIWFPHAGIYARPVPLVGR